MRRWRLSEAFLSSYREKEPPWGPLGWVTYYRTYSRFKEDGQKEAWWETVRRVVEGNVNLVPDDPTMTEEELMEMYDTIFHMAWLPAGRGLWMSGTPLSFESADVLCNCWGTVVGLHEGRISYPFQFLMDEAMKGGGVGINVQRRYLQAMPPVKNPVRLALTLSASHPDYMDVMPWLDREIPEGAFVYEVQDSREGWTHALSLVIDSHFSGLERLLIDLSQVRPSGQPIRRFGGVASGPAALAELLFQVNRVLNRRVGQRLTSVDVLDIVNLIGRCVVAGNVRRTAILILGDLDDLAFRQAKDWTQVDAILERDEQGNVIWEKGQSGTWYRRVKPLKLTGLDQTQYEDLTYTAWAQDNHRWSSNNSVVVTALDDLQEIASNIMVNGEPGVVNLNLAQNSGRLIEGKKSGVDKYVVTPNPCAEIFLENGEPCNLVEVFPYMTLKQGYDLHRILWLATRYAKRVTMAHYDWPHSREAIQRNRRIGVSLSGIQDWILLTGRKGLEERLDQMYQTVRETDRAYSKALGIPESIKVTTVKPSGTTALLPGVSPGLHWHYFRYGIRRIRFREDDPLVEVLRQSGYRVVPALQEPHSVVVEFPVKAPTANLPGFRAVSEVSLEEQFQNQALLQNWWADNSVSATLTFRPEEAKLIVPLLQRYMDSLKSTSLLPYSGHGYEQAPYEPVSEEEYRARVAEVVKRPEQVYNEDTSTELLELPECNTGACPVR